MYVILWWPFHMFRPLYDILRELIYLKNIACNNLSEDGMQGPKHVGGSSESNKYLWLQMRFVGIKNNIFP